MQYWRVCVFVCVAGSGLWRASENIMAASLARREIYCHAHLKFIYIVYTFVLIFDTCLRIYTGGMQIGVNKMDVFPLGYSFVFFVYVEHVFGHSCAFLLISGGRLRYPYPIPINFISEKILIYTYIYIMSRYTKNTKRYTPDKTLIFSARAGVRPKKIR